MKLSFREIISIDIRALAAFRICTGFLLFLDYYYRGLQLKLFYTDQGVLPRHVLLSKGYANYWSLNYINDQAFFQIILLALGFMFSLSFLLGYKTKWSQLFLWIITVSFHSRNPHVLNSGDILLRLMLFWSFFLPLSATFSLDRWIKHKSLASPHSNALASYASALFLLQLLLMYIFTAILKWHPAWHTNYLAVYYALDLEAFTSPLGKWLLQYLSLTKLLTMSTFYLELIGPFLLFLPIRVPFFRYLIPLSFIGLHLGLFLTMKLALFPWICIVYWLAFFPKSFWDLLAKKYGFVVNIIEKNLQSLNLKDSAPHWTPPSVFAPLRTLFLTVCLIGAMLWNINSIPRVKIHYPRYLHAFTQVFKVDQYWSMFAPYPLKISAWLVAEGTLVDGTKLDPLNRMKEIQWEKPKDFSRFYPTARWRKYITSIWIKKSRKAYKLYFGKYICKNWNKKFKDEKQLKTFKLYLMKEKSRPPGIPQKTVKKHVWNHECFKTEKDEKSEKKPGKDNSQESSSSNQELENRN